MLHPIAPQSLTAIRIFITVLDILAFGLSPVALWGTAWPQFGVAATLWWLSKK